MPKYNPNSPFWLGQALERAEQRLERANRRLEELRTRQAIVALDEKLQLLNEIIRRCHSPQQRQSK
jgi:hypothetical protein